MLQVYNILIHNSKDYAIFIVIKIVCIPCVVEYILVTYFIHSCFYLLIPYPILPLPGSLSPLVTTSLFPVSVSLVIVVVVVTFTS